MADVFSKAKRSEVMSQIRGNRNKTTEIKLAQIFRKHSITGWRRGQPLFGKPDFTFRRQRIIVFVDGCFWHGCPKHSRMPANNRDFWEKKLAANKRRDKLVTKTLRDLGWRVIRVWEHDLDSKNHPTQKLRRVFEVLRKNNGGS